LFSQLISMEKEETTPFENEDFNKNERQLNFNKVKGTVTELNEGEAFCSITLIVGHENTRNVNLVCKNKQFQSFKDKIKIGDKIFIKFYLSSRFKNGRWYTMANILSLDLAV